MADSAAPDDEVTMTSVVQLIQNTLNTLPTEQQHEVLDFALFLKGRTTRHPDLAERRARLAAALDRALEIQAYRDVDPLEWQCEQRRDHALPGRKI
jgi:hypothetical protein